MLKKIVEQTECVVGFLRYRRSMGVLALAGEESERQSGLNFLAEAIGQVAQVGARGADLELDVRPVTRVPALL